MPRKLNVLSSNRGMFPSINYSILETLKITLPALQVAVVSSPRIPFGTCIAMHLVATITTKSVSPIFALEMHRNTLLTVADCQ